MRRATMDTQGNPMDTQGNLRQGRRDFFGGVWRRAAIVGTLLWLGCVAAPLATSADASTVHPLPASNYNTRHACPPPTAGHPACLVGKLIPRTAAARARNHPLALTTKHLLKPADAVAEGGYGLRPQDLHAAYGLPDEAPTRQTVAIVDYTGDPHLEADLGVYDREFGLPECTKNNGCLTTVNTEGKEAPLPDDEGWSLEISADVEMAHAVCQRNCKILLVEGTNLEQGEESAVRLGATEISNSWISWPNPTVPNPAFNHPGVVITAAAGDWGYGDTAMPASSPDVVAVGGTRLTMTGGEWKSETAWPGTGGGCFPYPAPRWQMEVADWSSVGCGSNRAVADVSAVASSESPVALYDAGWVSAYGTSLSSPIIASAFALAGGSHGVAYPAQTLYSHLGQASLRNVTEGTNDRCQPIYTTGCTDPLESTIGCGPALLICHAGTGYNGPTGVGTPDGLGAFEPVAVNPPPVKPPPVNPPPVKPPPVNPPSVSFVSQFGSLGSGDAQFSYPEGMAVAPNGNLWVADAVNNRVDELSSSGAFIETVGWGVSDGNWRAEICTSNCRAGRAGSGEGQFEDPHGIAVDANGDVWVSDSGNNRVQELAPSGVYIKQFGATGIEPGQLEEPTGIAVDRSGNVWVSSSRYYRVEEFTSSGAYIRMLGNSPSSAAGMFEVPRGIAIDAQGDVWVADERADRVQEFSSSGQYLSSFGSSAVFSAPTSVAIDADGDVWVASRYSHQVQEFTPSGQQITAFGSYGDGTEQFNEVEGLAISGSLIYLADTVNNRIEVWQH
jgi:streptogramin lyase